MKFPAGFPAGIHSHRWLFFQGIFLFPVLCWVLPQDLMEFRRIYGVPNTQTLPKKMHFKTLESSSPPDNPGKILKLGFQIQNWDFRSYKEAPGNVLGQNLRQKSTFMSSWAASLYVFLLSSHFSPWFSQTPHFPQEFPFFPTDSLPDFWSGESQ